MRDVTAVYLQRLQAELDKAFSGSDASLTQVRMRVFERVRHLYKEQNLISSVLAELYRNDNWDSGIMNVLAKVGGYLRVSRVFILEKSSQQEDLILSHVWHCENNPSRKGVTLPRSASHHLFEYFSSNESYRITDLDNISPEYAGYLLSLDIVSCLIFPITEQGQVFGFIGLDECERKREWTEDETGIMDILAELVSHAILQRRAQKELIHSNQILISVLDSIQAIVVIVELETNKILYLNQFARNIFGDVIGEVCWEVLHGGLSAQCDNCPRPGHGAYQDEIVVTKEIENSVWKRWYHTTNSIIDWIDGKKGHLQIAIDITDRVEAENQIRISAVKLEELNLMKDKFISILAHDLKNPLNTLMGFAEIMRNRTYQLTYDEINEYSDLIHLATRNTHQLLQNLLTWAQSQSGKIKFSPIEVDLKQLLDNTVDFIKPIAQQKAIRIYKRYQKSRTAHIDPNMITTAVRNLMSNAVKFTRSGGEITLKLYQNGFFACIDVIDNGVGMSEEDLNKLFRIDIDYRSIGKGTTEKGTGLGLILTKEFITLHKGTIEVKSKEGMGTTFTICLPL